jgi:hypothetical protein
MNMKMKTEWLNNLPEPIKSFIKWQIAPLKSNLSTKVRSLKLSPKLLFYLMHYEIVSPWLEKVNSGFNDRLDNFSFGKMEPAMRRRDRKMVWITIPPSSLYKEHQRILQEAITFIHQRYPWKLRNWLPDRFKEFRAISEEIIRNTNPKEARSVDLSEEQKEWFYWWGNIPSRFNHIVIEGVVPPPTIEGVFERMLCEYNMMLDQLSKYRVMSRWLEEKHRHLHEFYLHGRGRYAQSEKVFPSIGERLKSLNKLVAVVDDLAICETAFMKELKCLMDNDLLFTSVFYSYFYKRKRGRPPRLKRKALEKAKPYIYYLKFFKIQPILWNGIEITSIYDLGVLLLNALAGERIYSTEKYDPLKDGSGSGVDGRYFKFKGASQLSKELDSFRQAFRKSN